MIPGRAAIAVSMPFPGEMSPNVERTKRDRRRSRPRDCTEPLPLRRPRTAGAPCWTTQIFSGAQPFIARSSSRSLRHHDHTLRLLAQRGQHVALVIRRLRAHRVKRQDERSSRAPARTTARTPCPHRQRSRIHAATGRRRRRVDPAALPPGRNRPALPATRSRGHQAAAGSTPHPRSRLHSRSHARSRE